MHPGQWLQQQAFKTGTLPPNSLPKATHLDEDLSPVAALGHLTSGRHFTTQNELPHYSRKEYLAA